MVNNAEILSISGYVNKLSNKEIGHFDIPEEHRLNRNIVNMERKLGIRTSGKRGYDVIRQRFFVKENVLTKNYDDELVEKDIETTFEDFHSYFEFLNGDIYENACYYQYSFTKEEISLYRIDLSRINISGFIDYTITSISTESPKNDLLKYEEAENEKIIRKKWIAKFNKCKTYEQFQKVITQFNASGFSTFDLGFYIYNFIFSGKEESFNIIMQYISDGNSENMLHNLCIIYDSQKVIQAYNPTCYSKQTNYKKKKKLRDFAKQLEQADIQYRNYSYFEEKTHFYRYQVRGYTDTNQTYPFVAYPIYFETFNKLVDFLGNDLSNCDLSKAYLIDIDFSVYRTSETTILPTHSQSQLTHKAYKGYDRKSDRFFYQEVWKDKNGNIVKQSEPFGFEYFCDFVYFLENDLSNADLLFCDGLSNIHDVSNINLSGAKLHSRIRDQFKITYQLSPLDTSTLKSFNSIIKNEEDTVAALEHRRETYNDIETIIANQRVYYISDLHLMHHLNGKCKTEEDIIYELQHIIDKILNDIEQVLGKKSMLLIGGDTSSNFQIFNKFIRLLRHSINTQHKNIEVIFILGNHELWQFPNNTFNEIIQEYKTVLVSQRMHLLQNDILYLDSGNNIHRITTNELITLKREDIRNRLKSARVILFGGLAFSSKNIKFNANNGIYRKTITRNQEIEESDKFNHLYKLICNIIPDRNVVVLTHTPQKDWCDDDSQQTGFIYVSGHTHKNYFYDDGDSRIYADNQLGYKPIAPHLKYFYLDDTYDIFSDYVDGMYSITKEQYIDFYRGKNIIMDFNRDINLLYMLKKNGYYCFIHKAINGNLTILNGGARKSLAINDIQYYYANMNMVINYIRQPLDKFTIIQRQIANIVKKIGGKGTIHGAIVDIDFYNHIYANPIDGTITGYYATDMIYKEVFPSVQRLLETNCPSLYENYIKMIAGDTKSELAIPDSTAPNIPARIYLDTDIYKASREIKKMQKLNSNILSTWYEPTRPMIE